MTLRGDPAGRPRRGSEAYTATEEALVARLRMLSAESTASPDEERRAVTRARLVAMAAVRTPVAGTARRPPVRAGAVRRLLAGAAAAPPPRRRVRLAAGLAGAALTVLTVGGLLASVQDAHPGDLLYDLKRGGEQTQLALAGDSGRGPALLGFATTRLDELVGLVEVRPDADAVVGATPSGGGTGLAAGADVDLVLDTLRTMDAETTEGTAALTSRAVQVSDTGALSMLTDWAADQRARLAEVGEEVPVGARGALAGSRELVDRVAARGNALEAALGCASGPATQASDDLGPLPAACVPVVTTPPDRTAAAPTGSGEPAPTGPFAPRTATPGSTAPSGPTTSAPTPSSPTTSSPTTGSTTTRPTPTEPARSSSASPGTGTPASAPDGTPGSPSAPAPLPSSGSSTAVSTPSGPVGGQ